MHHANHFYGHAHRLARYCGLDSEPPPRIRGYLQHGWNIGDGIGNLRYVEGSPIFVWSGQTRRRSLAHGRRNVHVVGAPFAYLLSESSAVADADRDGTIWYPFHGWEKQQVAGDHRRLIATINAVETGPVTVCLYWKEHRDPQLRALYERAGFRVICHGYRGYHWRDTDVHFLDKQLAELRRHRRVASNRLATAILYGAAAGCEPAVYGDPMVLENEDASLGGLDRVRRQWAQLHGEQVDPELARQVAAEELGQDCLLPPPVLRELLGWSSAPSAEAAA
jgi:hypothetical protein